MTKILLLSDTHSHIDERILYYATGVNEVWHAGDMGNLEVSNNLLKIAPLKGVFGNIDGQEIRSIYPEIMEFYCEQVKVFITHIGGYPSHYSKGIKEKLFISKPNLFICGHSHILKIMHDKNLNLLHINPGAAGKYGFHKARTMVRFVIHKTEIKEVEVIQLENR